MSYLLSKLPFDNVLLRDFECIYANVIQEETSVVALRNVTQQAPELIVIAPQQVSALMDGFTFISTEILDYDPHKTLDDFW